MKNLNLELSNFLEDDEFSFLEDNKEIYENDNAHTEAYSFCI